MSLVFEGWFNSSTYTSDSSDQSIDRSNNGLMLDSQGHLYLEDDQVDTPKQFYFFDLSSNQMFLVDRTRHKSMIQPVHELDRIESHSGEKLYFRVTSFHYERGDKRSDHKRRSDHKQRVSEWISVDLSKGLLPEISTEMISSDQSYYELKLTPLSLAYPLNSSSHKDLSKGRVWVGGLSSPQTLSYLLIEFNPDKTYRTRLIQTLLLPEVPSPKVVQTIQTTLSEYQAQLNQVTAKLTQLDPSNQPKDITRPLKMNPPVYTLGVLSHRLYLADHRGDLIYDFLGVTQLVDIPPTNTLVLVDQTRIESESEEKGLRLTFRPRVDGNKGLPEGLDLLPADQFETLTLFHVRNGAIYRERRRIHREDYTETITLVGKTDDGSIIRQPLQIQYGALLDKQVEINLDVSMDELVDGRIDITDDFLDQVSSWLPQLESTEESRLSFHYLTHPRGFDLKVAPKRLVLKIFRPPPSDQPFTMTRKVIIQGTLRPILITVRVNPFSPNHH